MRDYQRTKSNPYYLPHTVYRRALALVRDYPRMCKAREEIIMASSEGHGGGGIGRPTEAKALRILTLDDDIYIVDRALNRIPREYRQGVLDNIISGIRQDDLPAASRRTWQTWRARFLWHVAKGKKWI